jgi:putative NADH-flavin reductase
MKIAVIGANGKTGQVFVNEAVQRGFEVRAGVFRTNSFKKSDYIDVMQCDATKLEDVEKLIEGCDVVVSLIGHVKGSPAFLQTSSTANILSAMKKHNISRVMSLTGTGVRIPGDTPSLVDKMLNIAVKLADPERIVDGIAHADVLRESDLDWTLLRVLKLTDLPLHKYALSSGGPARLLVSRHVVADALLKIVADKTYIKKAPVVS